MKRIRVADTLLLSGDTVADLIAQYAVLVARVRTADSVTLQAIDGGGDLITATIVLTEATAVVIETTNSTLSDPENEEAEQYLVGRLKHWNTVDPELTEDALLPDERGEQA